MYSVPYLKIPTILSNFDNIATVYLHTNEQKRRESECLDLNPTKEWDTCLQNRENKSINLT